MNTTAYLLAASAEIWKAYYRHPFVLGIQNGTLDKERFRFYLIQDDLYLEEYAKTFALGAAKAESLSSALLFSDYLAAINRERAVHGGYFEALSVREEELRTTPRALIAKHMLSERPEAESDPFYGAWVREYASAAYAAENEKLILALNAVTESASPAEMQRLRDIFVNCSRYELAFWDMAWQQKKD